MPAFYAAIDLAKNELRNAAIQNLPSAPSSPVKGQLYYDSTANILYYWNGTIWVSAAGGGTISPATTVTTQAVGDAAVVGTSTNYAREDHKHGREPFGPPSAEITFGLGSQTGSSPWVARSDHQHGNPTHDDAAHSAIHLNALAAPTAAVSMNNQNLTNLAAPVNNNDAATKIYVDNSVQGLDAKQSCKVATTANIANLLTGAPNVVDGVTLVANDRILVKDQTTPSANGIYYCANAGTGSNGIWGRSSDMDTWAEIPSAYTWIEQGTVNADTGWVCTSDQGGTLNTTNVTWVLFSSAGATFAGAGMTKTGNTLDVVAGDTSLIVNPDELHVNTAVIATVASLASYGKKFAAALAGTASPEVVTHNLNTRDILLTVLNGASPYTAVEVDWDATTVNTVTIRYNPNLGAGYRCVVMG